MRPLGVNSMRDPLPRHRSCVGLEEALKLSTEFSARSLAGEAPESLLVPVPSSPFCQFLPKPLGALTKAERTAFLKFYERVGSQLEDLAESIRNGVDLDEVAWNEITAGLQAGA